MKLRLAAVAAASGLALAACGSDGSDTDGEAGTAGGGAFPVTVDTMFGEVRIESQPERVVALGWGDAETALALGVQPVGASDWLAFGGDGVGPWAQGVYTQPPVIVGTVDPSFEEIAALDPDLILDVAASGEQQRYDTLAQIAPTVGPPEGATAYLTPRDDQITMIAAALGAPETGEALIDAIGQQFADAAAAHPEFAGKTVTVASYTSDGWGAYVSRDARVQFMQDLGFTNNPAVEAVDTDNFFIPISDENLGMLDADLLVVMPIYVDSSEVTDNPVFQQIPAVRDGRFLVLDSGSDIADAISLDSALSIPFAIEQLVPQLADTVG
ncbi:MAG: iron-siderophore ABC transporter substrate-binding protein [Rhodococcus sp.]|mgnify:FL=1|uniref:iron-siderophore ABC transporter substrate-binding protein n=1 Tax=Rhodococcus TaxID=1827 RepID=UPI0016AF0BE1|nr:MULTISPECIES: iron-siderophore ABC transporter substrate-binding protein [Rhodococcus]NLV79749.1 iron-siderophore ABC transporter substrate-binding protein [Rhodococcus sp. (in: high G+C Gram-positive bacteria)]